MINITLSDAFAMAAERVGERAESEMLTRLRRGEIKAFAETYVVQEVQVDYPADDADEWAWTIRLMEEQKRAMDTGHVRGLVELRREHGIELQAGFWVEAARVGTVAWRQSWASYREQPFQQPWPPRFGPVHLAMEIYIDAEAVEAAFPGSSASTSPGPTSGRRGGALKLEALEAIRALFPEGVPPAMTNDALHAELIAHARAKGVTRLWSVDTTLRAAERKT